MSILKSFIYEVLEQSTSNSRELHVFDFDGTLFKSPAPPLNWEDTESSWYGSVESLMPPHVNDSNIAKLWMSDVLSQALNSCSNPNIVCVMMTGRNGGNAELAKRIVELIDSVGLKFQDVLLREPKMSTKRFKLHRILEILKNDPSIQSVTLWDDKSDLLRFYEENIKNECDGIEVNIHHIT